MMTRIILKATFKDILAGYSPAPLRLGDAAPIVRKKSNTEVPPWISVLVVFLMLALIIGYFARTTDLHQSWPVLGVLAVIGTVLAVGILFLNGGTEKLPPPEATVLEVPAPILPPGVSGMVCATFTKSAAELELEGKAILGVAGTAQIRLKWFLLTQLVQGYSRRQDALNIHLQDRGAILVHRAWLQNDGKWDAFVDLVSRHLNELDASACCDQCGQSTPSLIEWGTQRLCHTCKELEAAKLREGVAPGG